VLALIAQQQGVAVGGAQFPQPGTLASAIVLGSETVKVLTHSKIPVLVYR
jgi:hypothetical protein